MKTLTPFFFLFFFLNASLIAQNAYTSNGTGNWNDASIWTPNGIPGANDTAIVNTGTITLTDNVTIAGLYMSAGTITGDSSLTITDSLAWTGGVITFTTPAIEVKPELTLATSAKANINATFKVYRPLVNKGEIYWLKGHLNLDIYFWNYGTIFDKTTETTFITSSYQKTFTNYGKYIKLASGISEVRFTGFTNTGTVDVEIGQLRLPASYQPETGSYLVGKQGVLKITGPRTFEGPVHCDGLLNLTSQYTFHIKDTFDIKGEFRPDGTNWAIFDEGSTPLLDSCMVSVGNHLVFSTGKKVIIDSLKTTYAGAGVACNDSVVIRKYADFKGGLIGGATGVLIFDEGAEINFSLKQNVVSNEFQGQVDNYGTIHWREGFLIFQYVNNVKTPEFNNYGLFIDEITKSCGIYQRYVTPCFNNYGIYQKKSSFPTSFSNVLFKNKKTGVIKGEGNLVFNIPIENMGTVSPGDSVGVLSLTGEYLSDSVSSVNIDIGGNVADTLYDRLEIDGSATLKGTLNINLSDDYIPDEGEVFKIMTFTSRTDTFDVVSGKNVSYCRYFALQYSDTSVMLEVYGIEPPQAEVDTISFRQDRPVEINVLANDTDPDGDTLLLLTVGNPSHGTAVVSGDSTITYTPETGFVGLDSMVYVIQKRSGCIDSSYAVVDVLSTVGIEELPFDASNSFHIGQNYPNPFDEFTTFNFSIPEVAFVELRIYSIHGKLMKVLVSKKLPVGSYNYEWETPQLEGGIYIYQFTAGKFIQTGKMFKIK